MNFNVNDGVVKMLELIDRSLALQHMAWAVIVIVGLVAIIHAVRWW